MTASLMVLCFLMLGFNLKWHIPHGIEWGVGRIYIGDSDRDSNYEFIFSTYGAHKIYFYELHLPNTWVIDSVSNLNQPLLWDGGDFDLDGFYDLVMQCGGRSLYWVGITVFESPDSFSYPTQEVWRDTVDIGTVQPICAYDIDKDGIPEIVQTGGEAVADWYINFSIYESIGDNSYEVKYFFESPETPTSTIAFGDFDSDGLNEFVLGTIDGQYSIFESPANDSYIPLFVNVQLPTANIKDCFTVPDMDGDGKLEFVVKGFTFPDARFRCFIFEATGNNTYQIIKTFVLTGLSNWDYAGGYSDVGDIDGDSIPEICLEACDYIYIIKSCGNDSFYVWQTLPGNPTGSCVRVTDDLDNNGLNEIVISGNNYTRIYEKTPFVTWLWPEPYDTAYACDTVYPRWKLDETISLDSLRLYWSNPQFGCHLIYQGLPTDTICSWVVPDTQSNMSNRFWLVVKGFGRYDSTYSPVFYVKRQGWIEEEANSQLAIQNLKLEIYPNPFRNYCAIKFQIPNSNDQNSLKIYDVSGRLVKSFNLKSCILNQVSSIIWDGSDDACHQLPIGVYFIQFEPEAGSIVKKVIKIK